MASFNEVRVVGIELQDNVQALKDAVDAVHTVSTAWTLNDIDGSLPADTAVKAALANYEAIVKPSNNMSDAISSVKAAE